MINYGGASIKKSLRLVIDTVIDNGRYLRDYRIKFRICQALEDVIFNQVGKILITNTNPHKRIWKNHLPGSMDPPAGIIEFGNSKKTTSLG
jgi:hypothetical protein